VRHLLVFLLACNSVFLLVAACRRDPDPPPSPPPQPTYYVPPPQVTTAAPPPATTAAAGLPCASDGDLQCAFARCIQGRCGGCASDADCKPNARCGPTLFGSACLFTAQPLPPADTAPPATTPPPPPPPPPPPASNDPFAAARESCFQKTNAYRAKVGVPPVARRGDKDACVDGQAQGDALARSAHATFGRCQEGGQNVCPGYPGAPEAVLQTCLQQMFDEGPGEPFSAHGHYINMTNREFRGVSCGFFVASDGKLWVIQDFFR
jgi:hypothetical protein